MPRSAPGERADPGHLTRPPEGTHRAAGVGQPGAAAVGPRAASRRAGQRGGDPRRGAVGRRGAVTGGDLLGRSRTSQAGRDRPRGRAFLHRLSGRRSGAAAITVAARRIVIGEPESAPAAGTGTLADGPLAARLAARSRGDVPRNCARRFCGFVKQVELTFRRYVDDQPI